MATKVTIFLNSYYNGGVTTSSFGFPYITDPLVYTGESLFVEVRDGILEVADYVQGVSKSVLFGCPINIVRYWVFD